MSYSLEKLPDEPIVLIKCNKDFDPTTEMVAYSEQLMTLLGAQAEPTFTITDMRLVEVDLERLMQAANVSRSYTVPNIREAILVTDSDAIKLAMKGLDSDIYKHLKIRVFGDLDEALAYARNQLT